MMVLQELKRSKKNDLHIQKILQNINKKEQNDYSIRRNLLYKFVNGVDLLVVPKAMQNEIIQTAHQKGHFASKRTEQEIKRDYFIPDLKSKVDNFISNCVFCLVANNKQGKKEGFLHPLTKPDLPLHTYHVDHFFRPVGVYK